MFFIELNDELFRNAIVLLLYIILILGIVTHVSENISIKIPYCGRARKMAGI